jgi:Na+/proline symporter
VQAYISPPIAAVFLFGVFWPRANRHGAIAALAQRRGARRSRASSWS